MDLVFRSKGAIRFGSLLSEAAPASEDGAVDRINRVYTNRAEKCGMIHARRVTTARGGPP
ncbi:hypothetical protein BN903_13 [Halorubrum sp. AJ67]|nr:hypothetical protein BN903_13 [Halorubrum sp. AJ67]